MKKAVYFFSTALVMILSLNGCNKEIENPTENNSIKKGTPFEIIANPVQTRTTNDGLDTKWAAGDAIAVFHAVAGTTNYVKDGEFTISEAGLASNRFSGEISETLAEDKNYDWYMIYPYASQYTTPANTSAGYTTVGSKSNGSQTQTGNNSTAHLAGTNYPLLGKVSNVGNAAMPSVDVNQACSFIEFNVTNNSGADLVVSQISFTATEPIVGTYYINYADISNVVFTGSGNSYVSNVAKLSVEDGTAIANEGSAKFYIGIKPFSASSGTLKVAVNGYEKEITLSNKTSFTAGKIKKVNFNYDKLAGKGYVELDWESVPADDENGLTSAQLGEIDGVTLNADNDYAASNAPYLVKFSTSSHYAIIKTDTRIGKVMIGAKGFSAGSGTTLSKVVISGSSDGNSWDEIQSFDVPTEELNLTTTSPFDESFRYVKISLNKAKNNLGIGRIAISKYTPGVPEIVCSNVSGIAIQGGEFTTSYTLSNWEGDDDVTATCDGSIVTSATVSAGTVSYTVAPNYAKSTKTGTITLSSSSNDTSTSVTITQNASSGLTVSSTLVTIPVDAQSATFTLTTADYGWDAEVTPSEGVTSLSLSPTSGGASTNAQAITVTSNVEATSSIQALGTIVIYRNGNTSDSQKKVITIEKAATQAQGTTTATMQFGNNGTNINNASVTGKDDQNNSWTVTTVGTTSFTQSTNYSQVGSSKAPATSITFSTTLPATVSKVNSLSIKCGGFNGTVGTVTMMVGDDTVGTGSLNGTNDVTVESTTSSTERDITITITNIDKGVKVYNIIVNYQ